jgi:urease accessory protein
MANDENGSLLYRQVQGRTIAAQAFSRYPLKFFTVSQQGEQTCQTVMTGYGGGLLHVDAVRVSVVLETGAEALLTTQTSTKVYKVLERGSQSATTADTVRVAQGASQTLNASIADSAILVLLPYPVTCFEGAVYRQQNLFDLTAESAELVVCDWFTSGRMELAPVGEAWQFELLESLMRVTRCDRLLFLDPLLLTANASQTVSQRMRGMHVFGVLLFIGGRRLGSLIENLLADEAGKRKRVAVHHTAQLEVADECVWSSVSRIDGGGAVVRFAAQTTSEAMAFVQRTCTPLQAILNLTLPLFAPG